jgi:predicted dehydrogenase
MRIALVGCGRWGRNILRDLLGLELEVSVADPDEAARSYAESAGACELADDLDRLSESSGIVIATPTSSHAQVIQRALDRKVPVFVEKPMTCDAKHAHMLVDSAQGRLFVMDKWRYHPGIEELRRIRETLELGQPRGMHLHHAGWGQPHMDVDVSWILLPHTLSIFFEIFGELPPPNYAFAERRDGAVVTLVSVFGTEPWGTVEVSSRSPARRREFRLHCEGGVAWLDGGWADHIQVARGDGGAGTDAAGIEKRAVSTELPLMR